MTTPAYAAISDAPAEDRLAYAITEIARQSPESIAIVRSAGGDGRRAVNYSSLATQVAALEAALDATRPVGIVAREADRVARGDCGRLRTAARARGVSCR